MIPPCVPHAIKYEQGAAKRNPVGRLGGLKMAAVAANTWKPGMDLPYIMSLGPDSMLAIAIKAA